MSTTADSTATTAAEPVKLSANRRERSIRTDLIISRLLSLSLPTRSRTSPESGRVVGAAVRH
jgi:hypothetical protein